MGSRTMVSPDRVQGPHCPPLAGQASLYNLTFDEVQTQLGNIGKPLTTMNLDELVRNVISAEEGQLMQHPSSSPPATFFLRNLNMNGTLRRKTVDELWKEIVYHEHVNAADNQSVQRQLTLGETTLEDFLVRAGVINVESQDGLVNAQPLMAIDPMAAVSQQADWLQFQMAAVQQQQQRQMTVLDSNFHASESVFESPAASVGNSESLLAMSMPMPMPIPAAVATSSDCQATVEKKRILSDEMLEKTIERRQKRMIKNRESAARSRARKQAYTNQLEHEVFQLRKTNSWLKKQKEVEMLLSSNPTPTTKYQLRRTSSAPF